MTMTRRPQLYFFLGLVGLLALIVLYNWSRSPELALVLSADEKFQPLRVDNPSLRLDLLEKIRKLEYAGTHRNIFSASLPPPPPPPESEKKMTDSGPVLSPPPPPPSAPFQFFGYATDPQTGKRRAFFTNGEDVFIASEGEVLLTRFRLLRIGNSSADFEEVQTNRRMTLPLLTPPPGS